MTLRLEVHPRNPQHRFVRQATDVLRSGGLIAYPTDSCYALGCALDAPNGARTIARIRQIDKAHNFTFVCADLAQVSSYARIPNWAYRLVKAHTPGPYTFILAATREVPRRLQNAKRKTIGIRMPDHPVPMAILDELAAPIMSSTLLLPGGDRPLNDGVEIAEKLGGRIDMVIDSGSCGLEPSTVVEMTGEYPVVLREGKGDAALFS